RMVVSDLFLFIRRRHPISTLFPYTTLFRSGLGVGGAVNSGTESKKPGWLSAGVYIGCESVHGVHWQYGSPSSNPLETPSPSLSIDRKSTRLNSSHVAISYAVFCLQ